MQLTVEQNTCKMCCFLFRVHAMQKAVAINEVAFSGRIHHRKLEQISYNLYVVDRYIISSRSDKL